MRLQKYEKKIQRHLWDTSLVVRLKSRNWQKSHYYDIKSQNNENLLKWLDKSILREILWVKVNYMTVEIITVMKLSRNGQSSLWHEKDKIMRIFKNS